MHRQPPLPLFAAILLALGGLAAVHAQGPAGTEVKLPLGYSPLKMDRSADPRQDFYRYAAGQWLQQTEIPASDPDIGSFSLLGHQLDQKLLSLIEETAATTVAPKGSPRQQVGDFYRAAMDNARRDALGLKPLEADMNRIAAAGGTPADYGRLAARLQSAVGGSPLIMVGAMPDAKDSSTGVMVLAPGLQLLEQDEYTRPEHQKLRHLYHMYIVAMLNGIGEPIDAAKTQASRILSMEAQAAGAMLTLLQQRDPANTYNIMTLDQAQALMPALDLRVYLAELGIAVPSRVQVVDINAMKTLQKILTERPVDEIKLLLRWFLLASRAPELGQPWRLQEEAFTVERKGLKSPPEQAQVVTQQIGAQLYHPLSQLYVQAYFPDSTRRDITEMVGHIKAEFAAIRCSAA